MVSSINSAEFQNNPIDNSNDSYKQTLFERKNKYGNVWEELRAKFYKLNAIAHKTYATPKDKQLAEDAFFDMQLAGEHWVDASRQWARLV